MPCVSETSGSEPTPQHTEADEVVRLRLDLSYDGADFSGWAMQPGLRTVQGNLEEALATVLRIPRPRLTVAGRTDAGVHARGQVAHVEIPITSFAAVVGRSERRPEDALVSRLTGVLDSDVVVRSVNVAPAGFDARFSAIWRRYSYRIVDGVPDPLTRGWHVYHRRPLDHVAMNSAGHLLLGEHDFLAYCKPREGATTIRTLRSLAVERVDGVVEVNVSADAFCHSMVRSLVGALLAVGEGRREVSWPAHMLAAVRRDSSIALAPPHGLVLEEVGYPADDELAARALAARNVRVL